MDVVRIMFTKELKEMADKQKTSEEALEELRQMRSGFECCPNENKPNSHPQFFTKTHFFLPLFSYPISDQISGTRLDLDFQL